MLNVPIRKQGPLFITTCRHTCTTANRQATGGIIPHFDETCREIWKIYRKMTNTLFCQIFYILPRERNTLGTLRAIRSKSIIYILGSVIRPSLFGPTIHACYTSCNKRILCATSWVDVNFDNEGFCGFAQASFATVWSTNLIRAFVPPKRSHGLTRRCVKTFPAWQEMFFRSLSFYVDDQFLHHHVISYDKWWVAGREGTGGDGKGWERVWMRRKGTGAPKRPRAAGSESTLFSSIASIVMYSVEPTRRGVNTPR